LTKEKTKKRYLSGIRPTGDIHIGNYLGAVKNHIAAQDEHECFYFIASYHALDTVKDRDALRKNIVDAAITYYSLGLDPEKAAFWVQSDLPEVTELCWLLSSVTGIGLLERAVSFKDKVAKGMVASAALFNYPILMAADILAFKPDLVPVGKDQIQHVEMAQDMAQSFNFAYGAEVFPRPECSLPKKGAKVPGIDGEKMSKSYGNTIPVFDTDKNIKKRVMAIVTDSTPLEEPKDPDICNVYALYSLFASEQQTADLREKYKSGNFGYGHAKLALFELLKLQFGPFKERREELIKHPDTVMDYLKSGAIKAREVAGQTLAEARDACGLVYF